MCVCVVMFVCFGYRTETKIFAAAFIICGLSLSERRPAAPLNSIDVLQNQIPFFSF